MIHINVLLNDDPDALLVVIEIALLLIAYLYQFWSLAV